MREKKMERKRREGGTGEGYGKGVARISDQRYCLYG